MLGAGSSHAAMVSYALTLSSDDLTHISGTGFVTGNIPNGNTYATVTIEDSLSVSGQIDFTVSLSSYWAGICSGNCGIDSFGFNLTGAATTLAGGDITGGTLPTGWDKTFTGSNQDGFGSFAAVVTQLGAGGQPVRVNPDLTFSINLAGDSVADYIAGSIAGSNGSHFFAVHIAGFTDQNPLPSGGTCPGTPDANIQDCNLLTSAWVAGSTVVPVPAAVWLFGSGLLGLASFARRRKV
jgi:hypothetical protein